MSFAFLIAALFLSERPSPFSCTHAASSSPSQEKVKFELHLKNTTLMVKLFFRTTFTLFTLTLIKKYIHFM